MNTFTTTPIANDQPQQFLRGLLARLVDLFSASLESELEAIDTDEPVTIIPELQKRFHLVKGTSEIELSCWIHLNLDLMPSQQKFNHALLVSFWSEHGQMIKQLEIPYGESSLSFVMEVIDVPQVAHAVTIGTRFQMRPGCQEFRNVSVHQFSTSGVQVAA